jgi:PBS lyase HEAT-like repeat
MCGVPMKNCPVCKKKFDLHTSRFLFVRGNNIESFCSERCLEKYRSRTSSNSIFNYSEDFKPVNWVYSLVKLPIEFPQIPLKKIAIVSSLIVVLSTVWFLQEQLAPKSEMKFEDFVTVSHKPFVIVMKQKEKKVVEIEDETYKYHQQSLRILGEVVDGPIQTLWDFEAVELLARGGSVKAKEKLLEILKMDDMAKSGKAALILARIGNPKGINKLRKDLSSKRISTSSLAAFALGEIGDKKARRYLKQLMGIKHTRFSAARSALSLGFAPAKQWLYYIAVNGKRSGDRIRAAHALADSGDRRVLKILSNGLENSSNRYIAALGLAALGEKRVIPILQQAVKLIALRIEASKKLAALGSYESYRIMVPDLKSDYGPSQITAASAIFILTSGKISSGSLAFKGKIRDEYWTDKWLKL